MRWRAAAAIAIAASLAACGGGADNGGPTPPPDAEPGVLIIARPQEGVTQIVERDLTGDGETVLIASPARLTAVRDPAVSPDGTRIAYVVGHPLALADGKRSATTDIWTAARDGSGAEVVFTHRRANQTMEQPRWLDADTLLFIIRQAVEVNSLEGVTYTLVRYTIGGGGEPDVIAENVVQFGISPDGTYAVIAQPDIDLRHALSRIELADPNNLDLLVPAERGLAPFMSPRYSPDGEQIAFAASESTQAGRTSPRLASTGPAPEMHGAPQDIWLMDAAGGEPRKLAAIAETDPALAWSPDGRTLYAFAGTNLLAIDTDSGQTRTLASGAVHSQIAWARAD